MDPRATLTGRDVEYPVEDGQPMGESDEHRDEMKDYAIDVLLDRFAGDPQVYVSGNNFLYFTEGNPRDVVSPDAYVVQGVAKRPRDIYKVWEEGGRLPCFALEVTSKTTRHADLGDKMAIYRDDLRVPEYFLFDLRKDWIPEGLVGYVLRAGIYRPIRPGRGGRLASRELKLELAVVGGHLRFFLPGKNEPLPTRAERAEREQARAEREQARAEQAEAEAERLRAELAKLAPARKRPRRR